MRTVQETRNQIRELIVEWIVTLGMADWNIAHNFNERKNYASAEADPRYLEGVIRFNTKKMRKLSKWSFEETVIHELVHCLLWELVGETKKGSGREMADEQATTQVARALMKAKYYEGPNKLTEETSARSD